MQWPARGGPEAGRPGQRAPAGPARLGGRGQGDAKAGAGAGAQPSGNTARSGVFTRPELQRQGKEATGTVGSRDKAVGQVAGAVSKRRVVLHAEAVSAPASVASSQTDSGSGSSDEDGRRQGAGGARGRQELARRSVGVRPVSGPVPHLSGGRGRGRGQADARVGGRGNGMGQENPFRRMGERSSAPVSARMPAGRGGGRAGGRSARSSGSGGRSDSMSDGTDDADSEGEDSDGSVGSAPAGPRLARPPAAARGNAPPGPPAPATGPSKSSGGLFGRLFGSTQAPAPSAAASPRRPGLGRSQGPGEDTAPAPGRANTRGLPRPPGTSASAGSPGASRPLRASGLLPLPPRPLPGAARLPVSSRADASDSGSEDGTSSSGDEGQGPRGAGVSPRGRAAGVGGKGASGPRQGAVRAGQGATSAGPSSVRGPGAMGLRLARPPARSPGKGR